MIFHYFALTCVLAYEYLASDTPARGVTRLEEFEALHTYRAHRGEVFTTTVSYDGRYFASLFVSAM